MTPDVVQNVTHKTLALGYSVYPHTALPEPKSGPKSYVLNSTTCFSVPNNELTANMTAVNKCLQEHKECCVFASDLEGYSVGIVVGTIRVSQISSAPDQSQSHVMQLDI